VYEWDEAKREANPRKHKLDFVAAYLVYESPNKITYRQRTEPETRFKDVALVELQGAVLASRRERRRYAAAKTRSKNLLK
jgi:uncharacterized DUF497 family protein